MKLATSSGGNRGVIPLAGRAGYPSGTSTSRRRPPGSPDDARHLCFVEGAHSATGHPHGHRGQQQVLGGSGQPLPGGPFPHYVKMPRLLLPYPETFPAFSTRYS